MKKAMLLIAVALTGVGYLIVSLTGGGGHVSSGKLIIPEGIPAQFQATKEGLAPGCYIEAYVNDVTDGDTVEINYRNKAYKVRLLCLDTPESVKQGIGVQGYAVEASNMTKKLVYHKKVRLEFEKGLRDRYGRLLAYIILEKGENLNALLVRNGYARVEFVAPNKKNEAYFTKLQQEAIRDGAGLWGLDPAKQPFVRDKNGEYIPRYLLDKKAS